MYVIKLKKVRLVVHIAGARNMKNAYTIFVGNLKGREYSKDLGVDVRIILDWVGY